MEDCIFCSIASEKQSADIVYRDDDVIIFKDVNPKYRVHLLAIPRAHVATADIGEEHREVLGTVLVRAAEHARKEGLGESGFRLLINHGAHAGQVVDHLHVHILGGEPLRAI